MGPVEPPRAVELPQSFRSRLKKFSKRLDQHYRDGQPVATLLRRRSNYIDRLIRSCWQQFQWPEGNDVALLAVGGYGRAELHPQSDIDLLVLAADGRALAQSQGLIERLVAFLWDSGLQVSHSVRTLEDCAELAADVETMTSLLETRTIVGRDSLRRRLNALLAPREIWDSASFFHAKRSEQFARRARHSDIDQNLEPDVKNSVGGLRYLHTIEWVAVRHFDTRDYAALVERGFMTRPEAVALSEAKDFLWQVRYGLHLITGRREDRLLFEHQQKLAEWGGYRDDDEGLGIEKFMQRFYRHSQAVIELNELLLLNFEQNVLGVEEAGKVTPLNARFQVRNEDLEVMDGEVFDADPSALLEPFVLLGQNRAIRGIRVNTMREMRKRLHLIDAKFRANPRCQTYFMTFLRSRHRMSEHLALMKRLGILGAYLPEFGRVSGKMQYDLFHIYTVDAHTLQVVRNMRRFGKPGERELFSLAAQLVLRLHAPELLYIAGLYHDIGKGRGGDHSVLGVKDVGRFCRRHNLVESDANLVKWLVRHHLLMSHTAQRRDLTDPEVIRKFARQMGDMRRLNYLYCLTVADINATNPKLWTNWLATLLRQLYLRASRMLRSETAFRLNRKAQISQTRHAALSRLQGEGYDPDLVRLAWGDPGDEYFMRESPEDIIWHTRAMLAEGRDPDEPLLLIKPSTLRHFEGATQIFVRAPMRDNLFEVLASAIERLGLSVQDARLYRTDHGYQMHTFFVLDLHNRPIEVGGRLWERIEPALSATLAGSSEEPPQMPVRHLSRRLQQFRVVPEVSIVAEPGGKYSIVEVSALDRPGLLAWMARILLDLGLQLTNARVTTIGERVEDVFFITDRAGEAVRDPAVQQALCERLLKLLAPAPADAGQGAERSQKSLLASSDA